MHSVQIIISVATLLALFLAGRKFPIIKYIMLFVLFYFALVAFTINEKQSYFYLFGLLFGMLVEKYLGSRYQARSESVDLNGQSPGGNIAGSAYLLFAVGVAAGLFFLAKFLSSLKGEILGVAPLAVESMSSWQSKLTLAFAPTLSGSLAIIENYVFFGILIALVTYKDFFSFIFLFFARIPIPVFSQFMLWVANNAARVFPYVIVPLGFGVFHVTAYLFEWAKMIWAAVMFGLMMASYYVTNKDMTAADLFHFSWNNAVTSRETLSIVG